MPFKHFHQRLQRTKDSKHFGFRFFLKVHNILLLLSLKVIPYMSFFKIKSNIESRLLGEISVTSDMQMTPPLWQKVKKS